MEGLKKKVSKPAKDHSVHVWLVQWSRLRRCPHCAQTESRTLNLGPERAFSNAELILADLCINNTLPTTTRAAERYIVSRKVIIISGGCFIPE